MISALLQSLLLAVAPIAELPDAAETEREEERGLLLLKSEPTDCSITIDGVSVGRTPRLITDLPTSASYRVKLSKEGYIDRVITVSFNGRTPVVRNERLLPNSGTLEFTSEPTGAEVTVNGIPRGKTPLKVEGVAKGRAMVKLTLAGFRDETRELMVSAGETQALPMRMVPRPGTMFLTSVPEGARFYLGEEARGTGPLVITDLKPGAYEVRCEQEGYASVTRVLTIENGGSVREEFRLSNVMGRLEVRTDPVGATVFLDGKQLGVTTASGLGVAFSDVFPVDNLLEGEHVLTVRKDGYAEVVRHPKIQNSRTSHANIRMKRVFVPNIEIVTDRGTYRGILVSSSADELVIEVSLGIIRNFKRSDVRRLTNLTDIQ